MALVDIFRLELPLPAYITRIAVSACISLCPVVCSQAFAATISEGEFSANAGQYYFQNAFPGLLYVTDGFVTLSGGHIIFTGIIIKPVFGLGRAYVNFPGDIEMSFAEPVSAVGFRYKSYLPVTLSVFDTSATLLESQTIAPADADQICSTVPCGFLGINVGANLISSARITTTAPNNSVTIYSLFYQTAEVPLPGTLSLIAGAFAMIAAVRRLPI